MKRFAIALLAVTSLSVGSQIASAADLPVRGPVYKAPVVAPVSDWTGFYVGGSLGGRWNSTDWTTDNIDDPPVPGHLDNNPHKFDPASFRAGGYLGYNWQLNSAWVVGLEGDLAWANNNASIVGIPATAFVGPAADSAGIKDTWDGGIRGRVGYLVAPTLMLFATGGVSWLHSEAFAHCGNPSSWCAGVNEATARTDTASKNLVGWTLGGGLETMLTRNWLVRGEYRYSQYDSFSVSLLNGGSSNGSGNTDHVGATIGDHHTHTALLGIAYKW